jgi:hypothetical protein
MSPLDELASGLWRFTIARNGLPPTITAYALRDGENTILVDPLVAGETEPLLAALDEIVRGRVRILVTTPFHVRGSEPSVATLARPARGHDFRHELCATRLDDRSASHGCLTPSQGALSRLSDKVSDTSSHLSPAS